MSNILRNCQNIFLRGCTVLPSSQLRMRVPVPPNLHQHLNGQFLKFSHFNRCAMVSPCGFILHFPNEHNFEDLFHVPICHSYICRFTILHIFLSLESSLYILDISPSACKSTHNLQICSDNLWLFFSFS